MVWFSIPCVVAVCSHSMDVPAIAVYVSSHADTMDRMSVPIVTMPTPVLC
jgi:hypothetical protein